MKQHSINHKTLLLGTCWRELGFKTSLLSWAFALWSACEKKFYSKSQTICTSWGELSWIKWNDGGDCELWLSPASTTSATPSPAASPPRNLPFVTFQGSKETYLSLHNRTLLQKQVCIQLPTSAANVTLLAFAAQRHVLCAELMRYIFGTVQDKIKRISQIRF